MLAKKKKIASSSSSHSVALVTSIKFVLFLLVTVGALLSLFGTKGLDNISTEFDALSARALPVANASSVIVKSSLLAQQNMTEMVSSKTVEQLVNAHDTFDTNKALINESVSSLAALAVENNMPWLSEESHRFADELTEIDSFVVQVRQTQEQIITNEEAIVKARSMMDYAVSSSRSEMSRIGVELYGFDYEARNHVTNYINHSFEMATNLTNLLNAVDLKTAQQFERGLRTSNLAGMNYAWEELVKVNEALLSYPSITMPMDMVRGLFDDNGIVAIQLAKLALLEQQQAIVEDMESQVDIMMLQLDEMTLQSDRLIADAERSVLSANVNARRLLLLLSLVGLVLAVVAGLWVSRLVTKSLNDVDSVVKSMSHGDLTAQANESAPREFSTLARLINNSQRNNKETISRVTANSEDLRDASTASVAATNISKKALQTQTSDLATVASAITELEASIRDIANSTVESEKEAEAARELATNGVKIISESTNKLKQLDQQFAVNEERMIELDKHVNNITEVVDLISSIAGNTNLLALNAAIEAARAGEQGRGFAVVADEVRKLASETNDQTDSIRTSIQALHRSAEDANMAMRQSREEMTHTMTLSEGVGDAIHRIETVIGSMNEKIMMIATATQQQEQASSEVGRSVEKVAHQAQVNNQQLDQLLESAQKVSGIAETQRNMLSHYSV